MWGKHIKKNLKTPVVTILSSILATLFSLMSNVIHDQNYEKLIWILDLAIYTFILNVLLDFFIDIINNQRLTIKFRFMGANKTTEELYLQTESDYKTIRLVIELSGHRRLVQDTFRIYEKPGMTFSFEKLPDYISSPDGSYYEIDIPKLIGQPLSEKIDSPIRRTVRFDIKLDDYDNTYSDSIKVSIKRNCMHILKRKIDQKSIAIKRSEE